MSFDSAIPINRVAYGQAPRFDVKQDGRGAQQGPKGETKARQSVNISEDTLLRQARSRLSRAMLQKAAYNRTGQFSGEPAVGQLLSAKA